MDPGDRLATLATHHPEAIPVLVEHGLDFACRGGLTLAEACVDPVAVLEEIRARGGAPGPRWDEEPLERLVDHILSDFHAPLRIELPLVEEAAGRVLAAHGSTDPDLLMELLRLVERQGKDLAAHMAKEERVLFPWILSGGGRTAGHPVRAMQLEHEEAVALLERLARLTAGFQAPDHACATWSGLYEKLRKLDLDLRHHIHLENNILFPRALTR